MTDFLNLFMTVYNFMKNTQIMSFTIGEASVSITFLEVMIGTFCAWIAIEVLHHIFDW